MVYSHPQVFGQCKTYLKECLPRVQLREVGSTAEAARIVGGSDDVGIAAIASPYAAELYGCAVLEKHIEDDRENRTRFLVLGRKDDVSREGEHGGLGAEVEGGARVKSLVSFMLYHEKPGALADVLGVFRDAGMNLTSISSRPCRMHQWEYRFFVEVAGRVEVGSDVWEGLGRTATAIRCWGSWRASSL